jgi:hypothetical protein
MSLLKPPLAVWVGRQCEMLDSFALFCPLNQNDKIPVCAIENKTTIKVQGVKRDNLTKEDITDEITNFNKGNEILSKNTQSKLNTFFGIITNKKFPSESRKELLQQLDFAVDFFNFLDYTSRAFEFLLTDNFEPPTITPPSCNCPGKCANLSCPCIERGTVCNNGICHNTQGNSNFCGILLMIFTKGKDTCENNRHKRLRIG